MKILIIEDEKLLADSLKDMLEKKGFEVQVVYDGESGAEYAELGIYDLLILDVMMPKLDGFEVCRRLRQQSMVPIIMITARGEDYDKIMGLDIGADDYVIKPFSASEVMARVRAVLRRIQPAKTAWAWLIYLSI